MSRKDLPFPSSSTSSRMDAMATSANVYDEAYKLFSDASESIWLQRLEAIKGSFRVPGGNFLEDLIGKTEQRQYAAYERYYDEIKKLLGEYHEYKNSLPTSQVSQASDAGINLALTGGTSPSSISSGSALPSAADTEVVDPVATALQGAATIASFVSTVGTVVSSVANIVGMVRGLNLEVDRFNFERENTIKTFNFNKNLSLRQQSFTEQMARKDRGLREKELMINSSNFLKNMADSGYNLPDSVDAADVLRSLSGSSKYANVLARQGVESDNIASDKVISSARLSVFDDTDIADVLSDLTRLQIYASMAEERLSISSADAGMASNAATKSEAALRKDTADFQMIGSERDLRHDTMHAKNKSDNFDSEAYASYKSFAMHMVEKWRAKAVNGNPYYAQLLFNFMNNLPTGSLDISKDLYKNIVKPAANTFESKSDFRKDINWNRDVSDFEKNFFEKTGKGYMLSKVEPRLRLPR